MKSLKKVLAVVISAVLLICSMSIGAFAAPVRKIDMAFVIDSTGSMGDDIDEVKSNMTQYLKELDKSGMDYRIAIVEYRDFAERTGDIIDFAYRVTLDFTSNYETIINSINSVSLGYGGDEEETLYSALIDGLDELNWRQDSGKAAIVMGDAPALDPEPITGYTLEMVKSKMLYGKIGVSDERPEPSLSRKYSSDDRSAITLFTIATSTSSDTIECFSELAEATNGKSYTAIDTADISEIISEIVEKELPTVVEDDDEVTFFDMILEFLINVFYFFFWFLFI